MLSSRNPVRTQRDSQVLICPDSAHHLFVIIPVNVVLRVFFLPPGPTKTLFVKGLSEDTTDHSLKEAFDGAVAARIVTDKETGSSKG